MYTCTPSLLSLPSILAHSAPLEHWLLTSCWHLFYTWQYIYVNATLPIHPTLSFSPTRIMSTSSSSTTASLFVAMWMNLESVIQSEVSQKEKTNTYINAYTWNPKKKNGADEPICRAGIESPFVCFLQESHLSQSISCCYCC